MNQPIFVKKRELWWNTLLHWQFKGLYIGTLTTSYICARPCETELLEFLLHLLDAPNQPPICCAIQGATHLTPATWKFLRAAQQALDLDFFSVFSFSHTSDMSEMFMYIWRQFLEWKASNHPNLNLFSIENHGPAPPFLRKNFHCRLPWATMGKPM